MANETPPPSDTEPVKGEVTYPSWNEIFQEMVVGGPAAGAQLDLDGVRTAKMRAVEKITGRPLILYAVDMANQQKTGNNPLLSLINFNDKDGFTEAFRGIDENDVDILLQSPGGLAEATESIVALLRDRFKTVRYLVPSMAKSAACMLTMSGDQIMMRMASELGPIDPQMSTGRGSLAPARTILDQFEQAKGELKSDAGAMPAWLPILQQYGPSLLQECLHHLALSEELVSRWLQNYMFNGQDDAQAHAEDVAKKLNDHAFWRSHSRRVDIGWLRDVARLNIVDLASDPKLGAAVHAVHLALQITFSSSPAFKIVTNSRGGTLIGQAQIMTLQIPFQLPQPQPQPTPPPPVQH